MPRDLQLHSNWSNREPVWSAPRRRRRRQLTNGMALAWSWSQQWGRSGRWRSLRIQTENSNVWIGTPEWIRTTDLLLRRQTLYPTELRAHNENARLSVPNSPSV